MSKLSDLLASSQQNKATGTYNKQNTSTNVKRGKLQTLVDAVANNDQSIIQQYNNAHQEILHQNAQNANISSGIPDFKNTPLPKSDMDIYFNSLGKDFDILKSHVNTPTPLPETASHQKAQTLKSDINKLSGAVASIDNEKNTMKHILDGIFNPGQFTNKLKNTSPTPIPEDQVGKMLTDFNNTSYGNLRQLQKQHDDFFNSDEYVQDNMQRWLALINKTDPLTNEERDEAKAAMKILNTLIFRHNIEGLKNFDFTNQGHNLEYGRLRELLGSKVSAPTSFALGAGSSAPFMNKYFKEGYQSTVKYNDFGNPGLQKAAENADILANAHTNNPIAFTAGNITGTVAQMELGGAALKGLGVTSQAARNAIVMGGFNGFHSLANGDDALTVAANTAAGAAGGYLGSKVGELVGKGVMQKLLTTGLNIKAIGAISSISNGLSFGVTQQAIMEAKNAGEAAITGKEYRPDIEGLIINSFIVVLFGTLEAFKATPGVPELQARVKSGDPAAIKEATDFINAHTDEIEATAKEQYEAILDTEPKKQNAELNTDSNTIDSAVTPQDGVLGDNAFNLVQGQASTPQGGKMSGSIENAKAETQSIVQKIRESIPIMEGTESVTALSGGEFSKSDKKLSEQVAEYFMTFGNKVLRKGFGEVIIDSRSIKNDIAHGIGRAKAITFAAVPDVIAKGEQFDYQSNWKGRGKESFLFIAPVDINGMRSYVGTVVMRGTDNFFYLHEVIDVNGNIIYINDNTAGTIKTGLTAQGGITGSPTVSSGTNIPQNVNGVKQQGNISDTGNTLTPVNTGNGAHSGSTYESLSDPRALKLLEKYNNNVPKTEAEKQAELTQLYEDLFAEQQTGKTAIEKDTGQGYNGNWDRLYDKNVQGTGDGIGRTAEGAGKTSLDSDILIDSYKNMRNNPDVTGQAHHLNQDAAFRDVIPKNDGLCVELEGNAFRDVGSAHYSAHENLESFWNNFRSKGDLYGDTPKISDYNSALYDSLRAAGLSDAQAKVAVQNAVRQQSQYGLVGDSFVPRIPGRINFKR